MNRRLRLKWKRTWNDKPRDFTPLNETGVEIGRVYYRGTGAPGTHCWVWFGHGGVTHVQFGQGEGETKMDACEALERAYFARQARSATLDQ
ncbi:MAG: hypothetical protein IT552_12350 [Sphingomonadaceae bacterium]|nr:hypothetical protein [Sphingomonadaceae bacterium]